MVQGQGYAHNHHRIFTKSQFSIETTTAACTAEAPSLTRFLPVVKDKAQHAVILDKATNDRLQKDVQSYRLVTVAILVDRLKINGSLARKALADLEERGQIKKVVAHSKCTIYSASSSPRKSKARRNPTLLTFYLSSRDRFRVNDLMLGVRFFLAKMGME